MNSIQINNKLQELSSRPKSEKFTDNEIEFILEHSDIKEGVAKYCTWKQKRHNDCYILFMLDFQPFRVRKTGFDNSLEVVCKRPLTEIEKIEQAQNYGCRNRIASAWDYKDVECLIAEDQKYNIETPQEFVKHCKRKGYSNPDFQFIEQLKLAI